MQEKSEKKRRPRFVRSALIEGWLPVLTDQLVIG